MLCWLLLFTVASKCSSVGRVLVTDFMFFIRLNNCSQMYALPNMEDINNVCFLISGYFCETHWNKSQELESCRIYSLKQTHTDKLQTPVVGSMQSCQCPWKKGKLTFPLKFLSP
jgi:hypothetical protein